MKSHVRRLGMLEVPAGISNGIRDGVLLKYGMIWINPTGGM
jgi:hypothetical protein